MASLQDEIERVTQGCGHLDVIESLSTILTQAIADSSPTVEVAVETAKRLGATMGESIALNWHLVTARRKRG